MVIWFTGISGSGKSTLSKYFLKKFKKKNKKTIFIDGDQFRRLFLNDVKYSLRDRDRNAARLTSLVKYISDQEINVIVAANLTSQRFRNWNKKNIKNYLEIFIDVPMKILFQRDTKNLYKKAIKKKIKNVVGVDIKFRKPINPDLIINNHRSKKYLYQSYREIINKIRKKNIKFY